MSYYVLYLNSALNPLLYNVFSSNFRNGCAMLRVKLVRWVLGPRVRGFRGTGDRVVSGKKLKVVGKALFEQDVPQTILMRDIDDV